MARKSLTPYWFPHTVCERANCRQAAKDAIESTLEEREQNESLLASIATRHESQFAAFGWRDDAMAKIDVIDGETFWANEIVKQV